ncbi:hypothetical protein BC834DRAFT_849219 [Gloeopeniophorella convolvens]|nr:hypothetical protein BC834DRAFT_849219 [Gloeopeniophorella convolvens]
MEHEHKAPYYVLVSSLSKTQPAATSGPTAAVLSHPVVQYHYANDSPLSLLPTSSDEQVLVLDYDPLNPSFTRAQSISGSSAITGIKVTDAPGAGSSDADAQWSSKMFVLETTTFDSRVPTDERDPRALLAQFKQSNAVIQQVLEYESADLQSTVTPHVAVPGSERAGAARVD